MEEPEANKAKAGSESSVEDRELAFHEHARDQITHQVRTYAQELVRRSVDTAHDRNHPLVQQRDVQFAAHRLHTKVRSRTRTLLQVTGAGLVGVFLQGFASEMLAGSPNSWAVVVYVVVGFVGLFGLFWSLIS
jgi:histone H3/H4